MPNDYLEPLGRVVELEQVANTPPDHVLFVVRRDDDAYARLDGGRPDTPAAQPRGQCGGQWIADMRPRERG